MARLIGPILVLALLGVACSGEGVDPPPEELVVATGRVGDLDPLAGPAVDQGGAEALVVEQVFEGLTGYDPETLAVRPAVAASWDASGDATSFRFELRPGVRFHDGREVRARDAAFTLNRLASAGCRPASSPQSGAPSRLLEAVVGYAAVAEECARPGLEGVRVLADDVVEVALAEPFAGFPAVLGHPALAIVPSEGAEAGELSRRPIGTGPYVVTAPWDGTELHLERNPEYWGKEPMIPNVRVVGYENESLAYLDFVEGDVDHAPVPVSRARQARREFGDRGFAPRTGLVFFGLDLRKDAFAPAAFRQGLSLAVDRGALAGAIFEDLRDPARGLLSPVLPGVEGDACGELCEFDLEAARRLVAEAYPGGPPRIVVGVPSEGGSPALGEAVVRMFERAGVPAALEERPLARHVRAVAEGRVDVFSSVWIPEYPAPGAVLRPLFRSGSPDNRTGYASPEVDAALDEARRLLRPADRVAAYREAERRILADLPMLPLLRFRTNVVVDDRIQAPDGAVVVDGRGLTRFADLVFSGGRR